MSYKPLDLYQSPNLLAEKYAHHRVADRILLTGHSQQASPDLAFEAQKSAWMEAAIHAEESWDYAFEKSAQLRDHWRRILDDEEGYVSLAANVHELVVRFLSSLPLKKKPRIVTTDGEFPSISRQLNRYREEGVGILRVKTDPIDTLVARMRKKITATTAAVFISSVFYEKGDRVEGLAELAKTCTDKGALLFVDAYQSVNVLPFSIKDQQLQDAYVVGGGLKYCQSGPGNCFMRFPAHSKLRPAVTGWFGYFDALQDSPDSFPLVYGEGDALFDGSTFDPSSQYRAVSVFDFFQQENLTPEFLQEINRHQVHYLAAEFEAKDLNPEIVHRAVADKNLAGFLTLESSKARSLSEKMRDRGVHTDASKTIIRIGPAPYLSDEQLMDGMEALAESVREVERHGGK